MIFTGKIKKLDEKINELSDEEVKEILNIRKEKKEESRICPG